MQKIIELETVTRVHYAHFQHLNTINIQQNILDGIVHKLYCGSCQLILNLCQMAYNGNVHFLWENFIRFVILQIVVNMIVTKYMTKL